MKKIGVLVAVTMVFGLGGCNLAQQDAGASGPGSTGKDAIGPGQTLLEFSAGEKLILRVNCGGNLPDPGWIYKDKDGNVWLMDQPLKAGGQWGVEGEGGCFREKIEPPAGTSCPQVYLTERYGMDRYHFSLPAGKYSVRLHFAETFKGDAKPGDRVFDISLNGKKVLSDLDVLKESGGFATPLVKEFRNVDVGPEGLDLGFAKKVSEPLVNGIEIMGEQPLESPFAIVSNPPQSSEKPQQLPPPPGEPLLRVICGATLPEGYVYRVGRVDWLSGQNMTDGKAYGNVCGNGGMRVAPIIFPGTDMPGVYRFELCGLDRYEFRLSDGKYALRLHFAESFENNFKPGLRVFDIKVNDKTVLTDYDPFAAGGGWARPSVVEVDGVKPEGGILSIGFAAKTKAQGPAISGIEVFKAPDSRREKVICLTTPAKPLVVGNLDPARPAKKILFIGNSLIFYWALPETLEAMVNSGQKNTQIEEHGYLVGGKDLRWFLSGDPKKGAIREIETGHYDYVVVLTKPMPSVVEDVEEFAKLVKAAGSRLVLHSVISEPASDVEKQKLREVLDLARKYDAVYVPIGQAWSVGRRERPDLTWRNQDGHHPGFHQAYLAACIHYLVWTGQSPAGHPYPYLVKLGCRVDDESARYLQDLACRVYEQFKNEYGICGLDDHYPLPASQQAGD